MQSSTVITPKVEKYPNKPITLLVPFSAGGPLDLLARTLEKSSLKYLEQPLIVVNRPGGTGTICWNELANSNPDGYTIGITSSELLLQPLFASTEFDYITALDPLAQITVTPVAMAVRTDQSLQNIPDLINYAKQHPGQLKFGHAGVGSIPNIVGETFCKTTDVTINQVPFQGPSEAIAALLGGHIQIVFVNAGATKEYVKSGMIKILAVASKHHLTDPILADAQTFKEQGIDISYSNKFGIAVPKETPVDVKNKLIERFNAMITDPKFKKDIENIGLQYEYLGPKETQKQWLVDNQELTKAVQETGIIDLIKAQKQ